ncbi:MAG TPA: aldo/keto reductase [Candidatus Dormibacteraeota bacterium]|jgi:aryl-alcohol dehydrogenase-like predicted oxidoreductase
MTPRRLGTSGLAVSVVGLGTNNFGMKLDLEQSRAVVHAALDHGINLFDTSDSYGDSEQRLGEILQGSRDDVLIATKFGSDVRRLGQDNGMDWGARGSRRYIRRAVENSLRRLRTEWIDLYQMHVPDPATPIEETLSTLDDLVHEGKVRYLGHSNFSGWQTADAEWIARTRNLERFISAQNRYSLLERAIEADLVPALERYEIGLLPYFPLASGLLTGKYRRGEAPPEGSRIQVWKRESVLTADTFDVLEKLEAFARERSITMLDVAIGGLAAQRTVSSVIAGATSPEQVAANVRAGEWQPTAADLAEIARITAPDQG